MKMRPGCLAALILLGFGGWGAYSVLRPPQIGGVAFNQLPPATQKARRVEAQKLVKAVEQVVTAPSAPQNATRKNAIPAAREKKPFTITANEDQLNTLIQDRLKTENFPIHDLRVGLTPGVLTLQGSANVKGFDVPATLSGSLEARAGALQFQVDSLNVSGLPAPGELKQKAQKSIGEGLSRAFGRAKNTRVEAVTIENRQLTIRGTTLPPTG